MKKLFVNIIALTGLAITVVASSCTVQHRPKRVHNYKNDRYYRYDHRDYDRYRDHRYAPPRQY